MSSALATIAPDLFDRMRDALADLPDTQRTVYELVHGLDHDGLTEPCSVLAAADALDIPRGSARWHLVQAECSVYRAIAMHLLSERVALEDDQALPDPGESVAPDMAAGGMRFHSFTGGTVLGERSERFVREAKRSDAKGRTEALIRAHRECVA